MESKSFVFDDGYVSSGYDGDRIRIGGPTVMSGYVSIYMTIDDAIDLEKWLRKTLPKKSRSTTPKERNKDG